MLDQLGWNEIVLVEKRNSPEDFEKNKSFNYLVEARGQRLLDKLGILERLEDYGVATKEFVATTAFPSGRVETKKVDIVPKDRPLCYWTTRRAFLSMLNEALAERGTSHVSVLYGYEVAAIRNEADQAIEVEVRDAQGNPHYFRPDLILACDGINSVIRREAAATDQLPSRHFEMIAGTSLSTGLRYKVLNLPPQFNLRNGHAIDDPEMTYIIPSRHRNPQKACSLFAFPVTDSNQPRSVNVVREANHLIWTLKTSDALLDFLEDSFPQLDVRSLVSREEADDFVNLSAGAFPAPQYARNHHACIGPAEQPTHVLLIGDAAHCFPPDLGLGVNAALQDISVLSEQFENVGTLKEAAVNYAKVREPESRDLAWLVRVAFPEQYNHRPWRLRMWGAGFFFRRGLHAVAPSIFDRPAYDLSQNPVMTFGEMRYRIERTNRRILWLAAGLVSLLGIDAYLLYVLR